MTIETGILLICKDKGCEFRWIPNSSIKPVRCPRCQKMADFQKSKDRIEKNKILLSQSTLYGNIKRTAPIKVKIPQKKKGGLKEPKTAKWKEKDLNKLISHVQMNCCNPYIRERDKVLFGKCISCNSEITQAGHRYSVGDFPGMRFWINNIHGQEISCNHFKSGNIDDYDRGLILRHGKEYQEQLKSDSDLYLKKGNHWSRFDVIEIGVTYKYLLKNKVWIFTQKEFNHYREIANKNIYSNHKK